MIFRHNFSSTTAKRQQRTAHTSSTWAQVFCRRYYTQLKARRHKRDTITDCLEACRQGLARREKGERMKTANDFALPLSNFRRVMPVSKHQGTLSHSTSQILAAQAAELTAWNPSPANCANCTVTQELHPVASQSGVCNLPLTLAPAATQADVARCDTEQGKLIGAEPFSELTCQEEDRNRIEDVEQSLFDVRNEIGAGSLHTSHLVYAWSHCTRTKRRIGQTNGRLRLTGPKEENAANGPHSLKDTSSRCQPTVSRGTSTMRKAARQCAEQIHNLKTS
jgi:hypothetical protein